MPKTNRKQQPEPALKPGKQPYKVAGFACNRTNFEHTQVLKAGKTGNYMTAVKPTDNNLALP
jgi:hypothetical protein